MPRIVLHSINWLDCLRGILPRRKYNFSDTCTWTYVVYSTAVFGFIYLTYQVLLNINQPLADAHAFRQTQTALTAYWILVEGWNLAYQTPVVGYPWSIPFEFPIYQSTVAAITAFSGFELAPIGRFVSYLFLIAVVWPAAMIKQRLDLPKFFPWVFCALLWTTPLYLYWGRTFMIETAAMFFTLACLPFGIDIIRKEGGWATIICYIALGSSAVAQKGTTGGPVILFLLAALIVYNYKLCVNDLRKYRDILFRLFVLGLPLLIGIVWNNYADLVKSANKFGALLTTSALNAWNFGTLGQRLDINTWITLLWQRSGLLNFFGLLVMSAAIIFSLSSGKAGAKRSYYARVILIAMALYFLPFLLFTNLHYIHDYYQAANLVFLIAALAVAISGILSIPPRVAILTSALTIFIVTINIFSYQGAYALVASRKLEELAKGSVQAFNVGNYLHYHTPEGSALAIFGQDWSSEIAFHSRRKAITVSSWFPELMEIWNNPEDHVGNLKLAAIVICPPSSVFPTYMDINDRMDRETHWDHVSVYGCEILINNQI